MRPGDKPISVMSVVLLAFVAGLVVMLLLALGLWFVLGILNAAMPVIPALGFWWCFLVVYVGNVVAGIVIMSRVERQP